MPRITVRTANRLTGRGDGVPVQAEAVPFSGKNLFFGKFLNADN